MRCGELTFLALQLLNSSRFKSISKQIFAQCCLQPPENVIPQMRRQLFAHRSVYLFFAGRGKGEKGRNCRFMTLTTVSVDCFPAAPPSSPGRSFICVSLCAQASCGRYVGQRSKEQEVGKQQTRVGHCRVSLLLACAANGETNHACSDALGVSPFASDLH